MAGTSVDYIIRLLRDDSDLKKQLKETGGSITDLSAHIKSEIKSALQEEMEGLKKLAKAAQGNSGNVTITKEIAEQAEFISGVLKEMRELNPAEEWTKNSKGFAQTFTNMHKQLSEVKTDIVSVQTSIANLTASFEKLGFKITPTVDMSGVVQQTEGAADNVARVGQSFTIIGEQAGRATLKANKSLEALEAKLAKIDEISKQTADDIKFDDHFDLGMQFADMVYDLQKAQNEVEHLKELLNDMPSSDPQYHNTVQKLASTYVKQSKIAHKMQLIDERYTTKFPGNISLQEAQKTNVTGLVDQAKTAIETYIHNARLALEEMSKEAITTKDGINIPLKLPSQADLVKTINNYIDGINESKAIHGIKIDVDDPANIIEDRYVRGYKDNPEDFDANTTALKKKTEDRFAQITQAIKDAQDNILTETQTWRKNMLNELKFKKDDFEFNFGDSLFQSLQDYLNEQGNELQFVVDQETIKTQLKDVIENSGLTLNGLGGTSTAVIDANAIAKAVYDGMQAAVTGQSLPSFDTKSTTEVTKKVTGEVADIVNSTDKYVKTITEKTINSERVIEALRDFAAASTKKGTGRKNVANWLGGIGIDIDAINKGASDDAIRTMLNNALMTKDKFGYAKGSLFADTLNDIKRFGITTGSKQEADVKSVVNEVVEMLSRMGINQEYWQESQRRYQSYDSYASAAKYGRPLAVLSKIRQPLKANSMKNFADGGYQRLTKDEYLGNLDSLVSFMDTLQSEYIGATNQEIQEAQQRAQQLKEEFETLDKEAEEAQKRVDAAKAEHDRLNAIPEDQLTTKDKLARTQAKKELDDATKAYTWNRRDAKDKKKEYLRLASYTDQEGKKHVGLIEQMLTKGNAQKTVYNEIKGQVNAFKDAILGIGENPTEETIQALEQVARNFFEQSGKMMSKLFNSYGKADTFQGRVTLQNGRAIDINSFGDFLKIKDDKEIANVDVYNDILMHKWDRSNSVKKSVPQDLDRPGYYVNKPKPPVDTANQIIEAQEFEALDKEDTTSLENAIKATEYRTQQLVEERENITKKFEELDQLIQAKEQEAARISGIVNALTDTERQAIVKAREKAQKTQAQKQNKYNVEKSNFENVETDIRQAEATLAYWQQYEPTTTEVEQKRSELNSKLAEAKKTSGTLATAQASAYDAYQKSLTNLEEANNAYNTYINKLVTEGLQKAFDNGDIKKLAEQRKISDLEAMGIIRDQLQKKFELSGRSDIHQLRMAVTEAEHTVRNKENTGTEDVYKKIEGQISDNNKRIVELEQEISSITLDTLQAKKDAVIAEQQATLRQLAKQRKSILGKQARAEVAAQSATTVIGNDILLQQQAVQRELDGLRAERDKASSGIAQTTSVIEENKKHQELLGLQIQYNQLKTQEKNLQREINQLEDGDSKQTKISELESVVQKLTEVENKVKSLGGTVNKTAQKQYTEEEIKADALAQAEQIYNKLVMAKAQKRAFDDEIDDLAKREEAVRKGGLTASDGRKAEWQLKSSARKDFRQSEYYKNIYNHKKETLQQQLDDFATKHNDDEVQQKRRELWNALDAEMDAIVAEYITSIKADKGKISVTDDKWKTIFSEFIANSQYATSAPGEIDLKQYVLDSLAKRKAIAKGESDAGGKDKQQYINDLTQLVTTLEQELEKALTYGGYTKADLKYSDLHQKIQTTTSELAKTEKQQEEKQLELENALDELSNAKKQNLDTKPYKSRVKTLKTELQALDELHDRQEAEIENSKAQIELREEEKAASRASITDKLASAEKRLSENQIKLNNIKQEVAQNEKIAKEAESQFGVDSVEAERARLKLLYSQRYQAKLENNIARDTKKVQRWSQKVDTINETGTVTSGTTSSQGGIFSGVIAEMKAIASSMTGGTIDVDGSDIATETTLRAIFEMLSGGGQASADLDAEKARGKAERDARRKEEQARVIAEEKVTQQVQERIQEESKLEKARKLLNAEGVTRYDTILEAGKKAQNDVKDLSKNDILAAITKHIATNLTGKDVNTLDYVKAQHELFKMIVAYKDSLLKEGVQSGVSKKGNPYLNLDDVYKRDELTKLGDIKSLATGSYKGIAQSLIKLGYEAKLGRNNDVDVYKQAVETVRNAIGGFNMRSSNAKKAEQYNALGTEVRDAGNVIYKNLANATKEEKALFEKLKKLRDAANKIASQQASVQSETVDSDNVSKDEDTSSASESLIETVSRIQQRMSEIEGSNKSEDQTEMAALTEQLKQLGFDLDESVEADNKAEQAVVDAIAHASEQATVHEAASVPSDTVGAHAANQTSSSSGGIIGIMRSELAKESTLKQVLTALGEIAKKNTLANAGKSNSAQDLLEQFRRMLESDAWEGKERVAYVDLATGSMSNSITGNDKAISAERLNILRAAYKDVMDLNAQVHTHANADDPYFSKDDLNLFASDFTDGITKQILLSKNNMTVLDMTNVKDVNGLLDALIKTEQNFEALATTAEKFGAKYVNKAFNEITPQGLIKMLGIKGIESKYTEAETRDSARQGVLAEDAKEAADMLQESTGRAIKKTVERVGLELETLTEKTDAKGNKTWSSQISNKFGKAMQATNKDIEAQKLDEQFGADTKASKALEEYRTAYKQLTDYVNQFNNSTSETEKNGLQKQINELIPVFNKAEKELIDLIARKEQFLRVGEQLTSTSVLSQDDINRMTLEALATQEFFKDGLVAGQNIATAGTQSTKNGRQLLVDVLDNGTIARYGIEVDEVTGQVRKLSLAESDLANAFQNVNRAMRDSKTVAANVAIGENAEQVKQFLESASSPAWDTYKTSLAEMQTYTANLWNTMKAGGNVSQEELDYLLALSERVITLGNNVKKTSVDFRNFWTQNPENVFGIDKINYNPDDRDQKVREELEKRAKVYASANNAEYKFDSFDSDTLQFTLTDAEGQISKVTYQWNELYNQIAMVSDKSTSALDPMVAKINRYDEALQQAVKDGYLMADDANYEAFYRATDGVSFLVDGIKKGYETFDTAKDQLEDLRQEALKYGELAKKTINANKGWMVGNGAKKQVDNQYNKIAGAKLADGSAFASQFTDESLLWTQYTDAYKQLNADYQKYVKNNQISNPKIQQQIQQQAAQVQILGKRYLASVTQAEKLNDLVEQSGTFKDAKTGTELNLGGTTRVTTAELTNLEATMRDFVENGLKQGNIEGVKFDAVNQRLTYTFRNSKNTVADMVVQYNDATKALYAYQKQERESLTGFAGFMQSMKGKMKSILQYTTSITSIYRVWGELKRGVQYIREIDSALTELKKVTDETEKTYDRFLQTAAKTADKVGSTIKDVVSSTADWARIGYNLEDAATLAESTAILLNVSEFQSIEDATSALTSTLQAFGYTADQSMNVVDVLNEVGNNFAISSDGIATALQDSASSLMAANNSYEEAVALIAAANRVVQDPNSVGAALRTISLRLRGTSAKELEEAGEDTDGAIESKSKLRSKIKGLSGVDILTDTGAYKSTYDILLEISKVWKDMSDINQAALLEILAGKTRSNTAAAILSNTKDLEEAYVSALEAEGSALQENEKYLDSIQGRIDLFNNSVQTMWSNTLDSDVIKSIVDIGTKLIKIVDTLGLIPSILLAIGATKGLTWLFKGFDLSMLIKNISSLTMGTKVLEAATVKATMARMTDTAQYYLANSALVQYAISLKLATASEVASMTTTELLGLSFKALGVSIWEATKALISFLFTNPVGWMILLIGVVAGGIAIFNHFNKTTEKLTEELESLKTELSELQSQLESVNTELETTQSRMTELLAMNSLSFTEEEELKKLQKTNDELEREIYLLEQRQKRKQKEAEHTFDTVMDRAHNSATVSVMGAASITEEQDLNTRFYLYEQYLQEEQAARDELLEAEYSQDEKRIKKAEKAVKKAEKKTQQQRTYIDEKIEEYNELADGIDYELADDETKAYLDYIYNLVDKFNILNGDDDAKTHALKRIFNKKEYEDASEAIDSLVEQLKSKPNDKTIIDDLRAQLKLAEKDLNAVGLTLEDTIGYFTKVSVSSQFNTVEDKVKEFATATTKLSTLLTGSFSKEQIDLTTFVGPLDDVQRQFADMFKDGVVSDVAIAEYFSGDISDETRTYITRLVQNIYDGKIDVETALKQFEYFGIESTIDIQIADIQTNFKNVFPDLAEDADGLIDTFEELGQAIGSVANAFDTFNQAQKEMSYSGHVSIETALQLMEYTDDYGSILEVVNGKLRLVDGAEEALINSRIEAIRVSAEASLADATNAYHKAQLATQDYETALTSDLSAQVVSSSWEKVLASAAGLWEGIKSIITDESWTDAYNRGYNNTLSKITGYETEYTDSGYQTLVDAEQKAKEAMEAAQDRVELANQLTADTLESMYHSDVADGSRKTTAEQDAEDVFQQMQDYWENRIGASQARYEQIQNEIDLLEAKGQRASEGHYKKQIEIENQRKQLLESQRTETQAYLSTLKEGSEEWWEVANTLNDIEGELDDVTANVWELYDAIAQLNQELSEETHSRISNLTTDLENIRDILASEDMFDDEGNWTEAGVANLATYIQELETYKDGIKQIDQELSELNSWDSFKSKYKQELKLVNSNVDISKSYEGNQTYFKAYGINSAEEYKAFTDFLAKGITSEQEFYDEMIRLTDQRDEYTKGIKDSEEAVVEMYENQIDAIEEYTSALVEHYNDYISSVKEALDAERDLYEFKKDIQKQTKDIATLERRIASLSGSSNQADIAERRRLEAELLEAKEGLNDTYYSHAKDSQQEALDAEAQAYEETMNRYIEGLRITLEQATTDMVSFMNTIVGNVVANADTVYDKYTNTGLALDQTLVTPWKKAATEIAKFGGSEGALAAMNAWTAKGGSFDVFKTNATTQLQSPWTSGKSAANSFRDNAQSAMNKVYSNIKSNVADSISELNKLAVEIGKINDTEVKPTVNNNGGSGNGSGNNDSKYTGDDTDYAGGITNEGVWALQEVLNIVFRKGLKVDGIFGTGTKKALQEAQQSLGLTPDGKYGNATRKAILAHIDRLIALTQKEGLNTTEYKTAKRILPGAFYAKGTIGTTRDEWAITDEIGDELVLIPGKDGNLQYMRKGTGVIPADITENLMNWGKLNPNMMGISSATQGINMMSNYINKPELRLDVENFLRVDRVDQDTLPALEKMMDKKIDTFAKQLNYALKRK